MQATWCLLFDLFMKKWKFLSWPVMYIVSYISTKLAKYSKDSPLKLYSLKLYFYTMSPVFLNLFTLLEVFGQKFPTASICLIAVQIGRWCWICSGVFTLRVKEDVAVLVAPCSSGKLKKLFNWGRHLCHDDILEPCEIIKL